MNDVAVMEEESKGEKIPVVVKLDEPIVVEFNPNDKHFGQEDEKKEEEAVELTSIHIKATMDEALPEEEKEEALQEQKSLFMSFIDDVKTLLTVKGSIFN